MKKKKNGPHPIRSSKPPIDRLIASLEGEANAMLDWIQDDTTLDEDFAIAEAHHYMKLAALRLRRVRSARP